jgi:putative transposase
MENKNAPKGATRESPECNSDESPVCNSESPECNSDESPEYKNTKRRVNNMRIKGYDYSKDNMFFVTFNVSFKLMRKGVKGRLASRPNEVSRPNEASCPKSQNTNQLPEFHPQYPYYFGTITEGKIQLNEYGKIVEEQWLWLGKQYPFVRLHTEVVMPDHFHGIIEIKRDLIKNHPEKEKIKIKSLPELMGAFKTTSSKKIRQSGFIDFDWHRSYYGTIIFDMPSYVNISEYIRNNPYKWKKNKTISDQPCIIA